METFSNFDKSGIFLCPNRVFGTLLPQCHRGFSQGFHVMKAKGPIKDDPNFGIYAILLKGQVVEGILLKTVENILIYIILGHKFIK